MWGYIDFHSTDAEICSCQSWALSILVLRRFCTKMHWLQWAPGYSVSENPGWKSRLLLAFNLLKCPSACVLPRLNKCPPVSTAVQYLSMHFFIWSINQLVPQAAKVLCSSDQRACASPGCARCFARRLQTVTELFFRQPNISPLNSLNGPLLSWFLL